MSRSGITSRLSQGVKPKSRRPPFDGIPWRRTGTPSRTSRRYEGLRHFARWPTAPFDCAQGAWPCDRRANADTCTCAALRRKCRCGSPLRLSKSRILRLMAVPAIDTQDLTKVYTDTEREAGLREVGQSLVPPRPVLVWPRKGQ